ncbi:TPA: hypothetical protein TUM56_001137 [Streptococcus equi subsp. zooepidemicus]|uniref:Uncharacterized protein n=2 Tax=Streptococcus equi TaxID=1336 RepID=A0A7Z9D283_STRSZ|nr:hypothetical protein [Streptococcus equi]ASB97248.1 hypothetical protein SE071780_01659 [Streptococcus equi subsp. equi]KIS13529.1 hypothetical protein AT48_00785 [Streptococcus equi subsp. zooepidemicus SzAM60]KIS18827.1 hypothetical protein AT52_01554 [Streptococcus equi subsp. zooepidemicus Sz35]MBT1194784.1 hypothetical protein [Streptococcus equi subsp. equi]MBT1196774.1 hypothetical protein [Streptococcus equi subsp. equi]
MDSMTVDAEKASQLDLGIENAGWFHFKLTTAIKLKQVEKVFLFTAIFNRVDEFI